MPNEQLEENIAAIIDAVCKHRTPALGPFINRATLATIPTKNFISIDVEKLIPVPTEEDIEYVSFKSNVQ
jgi:hypothetical protein